MLHEKISKVILESISNQVESMKNVKLQFFSHFRL